MRESGYIQGWIPHAYAPFPTTRRLKEIRLDRIEGERLERSAVM